jgi:hypothetical protein
VNLTPVVQHVPWSLHFELLLLVIAPLLLLLQRMTFSQILSRIRVSYVIVPTADSRMLLMSIRTTVLLSPHNIRIDPW